MPTARGALTANFIDGVLYAVGSVGPSHNPVPINEAYDPKTNSWTEKDQCQLQDTI
jgi:N-acetylneuraminic acid mutarotase